MSAGRSIPARLRSAYATAYTRAAASSIVVRSLLLGALAIGVTVAGVAAGALIVAPVVATATRPARPVSVATAATTPAPSPSVPAFTTLQSAASTAWNRLDAGTASVLARLPEPMARYALPTVAVASITGALLALFLPSRDSSRSPVPIGASLLTPAQSAARLTPRSTARVGAKKRTPSAVEALAASGASAPDIAWRTGLPLDAVQLLLAISGGTRQFHPPAA